jgi:HK97 family phage major capsid protein
VTGVTRLWNSFAGVDYLDGIPAYESEYCAALGAQGDLVLCDLSRYVLAMRERLRGEVSIHIQFLTDQVAYKFVMRVAGQTIDRSAVTPMNGSVTTSPFVTLAART